MTFDTFSGIGWVCLCGIDHPRSEQYDGVCLCREFRLAAITRAYHGCCCRFFLLQLSVGAGLGAVILAFPVTLTVAKVFGALYLIWIAFKIGSSRQIGSTGKSTGAPLSFTQAVAFQWVNPKGWIMGADGDVRLYRKRKLCGFGRAGCAGVRGHYHPQHFLFGQFSAPVCGVGCLEGSV